MPNLQFESIKNGMHQKKMRYVKCRASVPVFQCSVQCSVFQCSRVPVFQCPVSSAVFGVPVSRHILDNIIVIGQQLEIIQAIFPGYQNRPTIWRVSRVSRESWLLCVHPIVRPSYSATLEVTNSQTD